METSRRSGGTEVKSSDPYSTRPESTGSTPAMMFRVVVFPHPEGPRRTRSSRSSTFRLRSSRTPTDPNRLRTFSNVTLVLTYEPVAAAVAVPALLAVIALLKAMAAEKPQAVFDGLLKSARAGVRLEDEPPRITVSHKLPEQSVVVDTAGSDGHAG